MIKNSKKEKVLKYFIFEFRSVEYNIDIQKLKSTVEILRLKIREDDIITNKNFEDFLKRNKLLIKEFLEYISKS